MANKVQIEGAIRADTQSIKHLRFGGNQHLSTVRPSRCFSRTEVPGSAPEVKEEQFRLALLSLRAERRPHGLTSEQTLAAS